MFEAISEAPLEATELRNQRYLSHPDMRVPDAQPVGGPRVPNGVFNGQPWLKKVYGGLRSMAFPMSTAIISFEAPNVNLQCINVFHRAAQLCSLPCAMGFAECPLGWAMRSLGGVIPCC